MRSFSKAWRVLTVLGMATVAMAPLTAAQASPTVDRRQGGEFEIHTFTGNCLDVGAPVPRPGAPIIQNSCDGRPTQRFRIERVGEQQYAIRASNGLCLDGRDPANGAPIIQFFCDGGPNQWFTILPVDDGEYRIQTSADKCLDVRDPANGTPIVQYDCGDQSSQRFTIVRD